MSLKQGRPPPAPSSGAAGVQLNMSSQGLSVSILKGNFKFP